MYTFGSAGTCSTEYANRKAFEKWRIVPRMLRDATVRDLEVGFSLFTALIDVKVLYHD
jgi:isopentenyl diphosphate isomerase/L-lactate dehydrogenase-like FMN-dependent dehydrogenase